MNENDFEANIFTLIKDLNLLDMTKEEIKDLSCIFTTVVFSGSDVRRIFFKDMLKTCKKAIEFISKKKVEILSSLTEEQKKTYEQMKKTKKGIKN
jgi:hypothetical protein